MADDAIHKMTIQPADNGGVVATNHGPDGETTHAFSPGDSQGLHDHVEKHMSAGQPQPSYWPLAIGSILDEAKDDQKNSDLLAQPR